MAILAEMEMRALCDQFGLPKDMEVDVLLDKLARQKQAEAATPKIDKAASQPAPPAEAPPQPERPAAAESPDARQMVAQAQVMLGQGRPNEALGMLAQAFSDNVKIMDMLNSIATLPPEEQTAQLAEVIQIAGRVLGLPEMSGPMADVPPGVPAEPAENGVA
jgi:pyruvate/2-oxoglutarate dehydrogenase complex dihydrolipoamide acyltransferase (E2) component